MGRVRVGFSVGSYALTPAPPLPTRRGRAYRHTTNKGEERKRKKEKEKKNRKGTADCRCGFPIHTERKKRRREEPLPPVSGAVLPLASPPPVLT